MDTITLGGPQVRHHLPLIPKTFHSAIRLPQCALIAMATMVSPTPSRNAWHLIPNIYTRKIMTPKIQQYYQPHLTAISNVDRVIVPLLMPTIEELQ
jgi:hypothetical protein